MSSLSRAALSAKKRSGREEIARLTDELNQERKRASQVEAEFEAVISHMEALDGASNAGTEAGGEAGATVDVAKYAKLKEDNKKLKARLKQYKDKGGDKSVIEKLEAAKQAEDELIGQLIPLKMELAMTKNELEEVSHLLYRSKRRNQTLMEKLTKYEVAMYS